MRERDVKVYFDHNSDVIHLNQKSNRLRNVTMRYASLRNK